MWGVFDLYMMVVYDAALTNAEALAVAQALMTAHNIVLIAELKHPTRHKSCESS